MITHALLRIKVNQLCPGFSQVVLGTICVKILYSFNRFINREKYVFKLLHSVYSLKQSNCSFYQKFYKALQDRYILLHPVCNFVFTLKNWILIVYVDDILIFSRKKCKLIYLLSLYLKKKNILKLLIKKIQINILGVDIKKYLESTYKISQFFLINRITEKLKLDNI